MTMAQEVLVSAVPLTLRRRPAPAPQFSRPETWSHSHYRAAVPTFGSAPMELIPVAVNMLRLGCLSPDFLSRRPPFEDLQRPVTANSVNRQCSFAIAEHDIEPARVSLRPESLGLGW